MRRFARVSSSLVSFLCVQMATDLESWSSAGSAYTGDGASTPRCDVWGFYGRQDSASHTASVLFSTAANTQQHQEQQQQQPHKVARPSPSGVALLTQSTPESFATAYSIPEAHRTEAPLNAGRPVFYGQGAQAPAHCARPPAAEWATGPGWGADHTPAPFPQPEASQHGRFCHLAHAGTDLCWQYRSPKRARHAERQDEEMPRLRDDKYARTWTSMRPPELQLVAPAPVLRPPPPAATTMGSAKCIADDVKDSATVTAANSLCSQPRKCVTSPRHRAANTQQRARCLPAGVAGSVSEAASEHVILKCCKFVKKSTDHACTSPLKVVPHKRGHFTVACSARHQWVWCDMCCNCRGARDNKPGERGCIVPSHWYERDAFDTGARNHMNVHRK